jgi:hypothetical protein
MRRAAEKALGEAAFRRWFRLLYSAVAVGTFTAYALWAAKLPDAEWRRFEGGAAAVLWLVRLGGCGLLWWAVAQFGAFSFLGLDALVRRWGEDPADGLGLGHLRATGPYVYIRHPMYAAGLLILWGEPVWTANRAAFILGATAYLLLGSVWEERRLLREHGEAYRRYAARTPRFLPHLWERKRYGGR